VGGEGVLVVEELGVAVQGVRRGVVVLMEIAPEQVEIAIEEGQADLMELVSKGLDLVVELEESRMIGGV
jgi:hypothetical protein